MQEAPTEFGPTLSRADVASLLPIDPRLFVANLSLACDIAQDLARTLERFSRELRLPGEGWIIFALYYAARIYGAVSGGIMLRGHGFDREAQFMERAMYEYFTKMLFYSTCREEGDRAIASAPRQYLDLIKKLKFDPTRFLNDEQMTLIEASIEYNADRDFTEMRNRLIRDTRFTKQADKPAVKFYLKESRNRWNLQWVGPTQVVHGSIMDVLAGSKLDANEMSVTAELDSLRPAPNGELLDSCQFAIFTARHVEIELGLAESHHRRPLMDALIIALQHSREMDQEHLLPK